VTRLFNDNIGITLFGGYIGSHQLIVENPDLKKSGRQKSTVDFIDNYLRAQNSAMILVKVDAHAS
jgi:hypothetical protein